MRETMSQRPLVSVVTIFLNGERFIQEAIESVLAQTYDNWEYLLVDDGSTDASTALARHYAELYPGKIRYLEHAGHVNRGMSATRNLGICHAQGKYIALLDADDVWLSYKLERQVALLEAHPQAAMVYGANQYWHSWTGAPEDAVRDHIPDLGVALNRLFEPGELSLLVYPLGKAAAPCPSDLLIRRDAITRLNGFEESFTGKYQMYEDQAFLAKMYLHEAVFVSDECWDRYRIHPDSCVAVVTESGHYHAVRFFFLQWFTDYLTRVKPAGQEVSHAVQAALEECSASLTQEEPTESASAGGMSVDIRRENWWLRVSEGSQAHLEFPQGSPEQVRVHIDMAQTTLSSDIQLNEPGLNVNAGHRYVINCLARADRLRSCSIGLAKAHAPWSNLGVHSEVDLSTEWQSYELVFVASESDDNARVYFDLGDSDISVEIATVTLRSLTEGLFVQPYACSELMPSPSSQADQPESIVPVGKVQFGSLRRVSPISRDWGWDRGLPVDRYYIEKFLAVHAHDIQGRVLEIGDNAYTRKFGGDHVAVSDVLHVTEGNPAATIVGDLASAAHISGNSFDCIILTQTLQLIYDVRAALATTYRILKPGGVLLATFPGISQTYDDEWNTQWFWNFTPLSARRLFTEVFPATKVQLETFGNVTAAISFLHGIASEELRPVELDQREAGYEVTIAMRAEKPRAITTVATGESAAQAVRGRHSTPQAKALVLMYHSIAETWPDPWGLNVTSEHFAQQLEVLKQYAYPTGLDELVKSVEENRLPGNAFSVTFDDGYANNLYTAKPILARYEIPATVFLATGSLGQAHGFWWNEIEQLVLQPGTLPPVLRLNIDGDVIQWDLGDMAAYKEEDASLYRSWHAWEAPPTTRHAFYYSLWQRLQGLRDEERQRALAAVRAWALCEQPAQSVQRALSVAEVVELAGGGLVTIGAHTVTHSVLSQLSAAEQRDEIEQSKRTLEELLGQPVLRFAYPYGAATTYTRDSIALVRDAGFQLACATQASVVSRGHDRFQLPRFQVLDWDGEEFARQLTLWFNS